MLNTILINVFALLLSFGIFAGHYTGKNSFDLAVFSKLISEHAVILIFLFIYLLYHYTYIIVMIDIIKELRINFPYLYLD